MLTSVREDYNQHSKSQLQAVLLAKPFIEKGVLSLRLALENPTHPITIADFGCSAGANSSVSMDLVITALRKSYPPLRTSSITVVHEDLPSNNWNEFFKCMYEDPKSYLKAHWGISLLASAQSFYEQVVPAKTLLFGFSSAALHWLSCMPVKMSNHCFVHHATREEWEVCHQQAAKDWKNFLKARSVELVQGGVLVLQMVQMDNECEFMVDSLYQAALILKERGFIKDQELLDFNLRVFARSLEDVTDREILEEFGFELLEAHQYPPTRNVYYEDYLRHGDVDRFLEEYGSIISVVIEPTFLNALSTERTQQEKKLVCIELWKEYNTLLKKHPNQCQLLWGNIVIILTKK